MTESNQQTEADLAPVAPTSDATLDSILRYQEDLWQRGQRPPVADLLAERPKLRDNTQAQMELIYNEVLLREENGESPQLEEYQRQYPGLADELVIGWQIDGLLASRRTARQSRPGLGLAGEADVRCVGRYEIRGVLGKGAMGIAYRAHDTLLKRIVALKMLRAADASDDQRNRFRDEAEAIARVRHPNVVQVFDVGEHQGQAYFAMEFCAGGTLADRLRGTPLSPAEAARVLEQIARGVAAAHAQKIVHRDLKPGNVLLSEAVAAKEGGSSTAVGSDSSGSAPALADFKVTDFGLAKHLDDDQGQTRSGVVLGTPSYLSPEQAFGHSRTVGPAADVYSLGAILYECLTGRPPFKGATTADTLDMVRHREPVPVRQLQPGTPRDLETICLKCLAKEPRQRYASAQGLADDLGRFREGRPILARPVGPLGRAWRWCKRNPVVAGLLTLVIGVLLAGVVSTSLALRQAWRNEVEAKRNLETANQNQARAEANEEAAFRAVDTAFRKVSEERLLSEPGMLDLRRDLLLASLPFYEEFVAKHQGDPRWARQLADATFRLGHVHYHLGSTARAKQCYLDALPLYRRLLEQEPSSTDLLRLEGACLMNVGHCLISEERYDEAERDFLAAQAIYSKLDDAGLMVAQISHQLALIAEHRQRFPEALKHATEAVERCLRLRPLDPDSQNEWVYTLGLCRGNRGSLLSRMGQPADALKELAEAMKVYETQLSKRPRAAQVLRTDLAKLRAIEGLIHLGQRRGKEAIAAFEAADAEFARLMREFPTVAAHSRDWAANMHNFTYACRLMGDLDKAAASQAKVLPVREQLHRDFPGLAQYAIDLSDSYREASHLARARGKPQEAPEWNARCVKVLRACLARHPDSTMAKSRLAGVAGGNAQTLTQLGRHAESLEYWDLCLEYGGAPNPALIRAYRASARAIVGDWRRAEQDVESVKIDDKTDPALVFALGCARAAMAEAVGKDESLPTVEREAKRKEGTKAALALLREARRRGHPRAPFETEQWKSERALSSLRKLPEFEAMLPK